MQRTLLLFALLLFCALATQAQDLRTVTGTVHDAAGQPVPMLTVALEGTTIGANTNDNGYFELKGIQPGTYTLRVGGVGYGSIRQQVDLTNSNANFDLSIKQTQQALQEVIVSAGRTVEALDETPASVYVLNSRALQVQSQISTNISNILAQTVPGLAINSNTTSNVGQTLRGRNVLVMIDGIPQSTPLRKDRKSVV